MPNMRFRLLDQTRQSAVTELFTTTFSSSAGEDEGRIVGGLACALAARIDDRDIIGVGAEADGALVGAIFFTRLRFEAPVDAYLLSPVAVGTLHQGRGVGKALIESGLASLTARAVSFVLTYGDPAFYSKLGFQPLSEAVIQAPLPLSMPHGWLGRPLSTAALPILRGRPACVAAFDNPAIW